MELHALGEGETQEQALARLVAERHDTVVALRELSKELDCNEWDDDLHLADVVSKHIGRSIDFEDR